MTWIEFPIVAIITIIFWIIAIIAYTLPAKKRYKTWIANFFSVTGFLILSIFVAMLWIRLGRPPLRTLGETRLWYSVFLSLTGIVIYQRWRYTWFIIFSLAMSILFVLINYFHPETYSKTLMPALQSPWFVPHVIVYILSYALFAGASIVAVIGIYQLYTRKFSDKILILSDNIVYVGFALITLGMLFGALWAKEAWGHYWTWDPKETWSFITWCGYLIYIHYRHYHPQHVKTPLWTLSLAFVFLLICWFGINYLPAAQNSVHVYSG